MRIQQTSPMQGGLVRALNAFENDPICVSTGFADSRACESRGAALCRTDVCLSGRRAQRAFRCKFVRPLGIGARIRGGVESSDEQGLQVATQHRGDEAVQRRDGAAASPSTRPLSLWRFRGGYEQKPFFCRVARPLSHLMRAAMSSTSPSGRVFGFRGASAYALLWSRVCTLR